MISFVHGEGGVQQHQNAENQDATPTPEAVAALRALAEQADCERVAVYDSPTHTVHRQCAQGRLTHTNTGSCSELIQYFAFAPRQCRVCLDPPNYTLQQRQALGLSEEAERNRKNVWFCSSHQGDHVRLHEQAGDYRGGWLAEPR